MASNTNQERWHKTGKKKKKIILRNVSSLKPPSVTQINENSKRIHEATAKYHPTLYKKSNMYPPVSVKSNHILATPFFLMPKIEGAKERVGATLC